MPDPCELLESSGASTDALAFQLDSPLSDTANALSAIVVAVALALSSEGAATDELVGEHLHNLSAAAVVSEVVTAHVITSENLVERAQASDAVTQQVTAVVAETAAATDTLVGTAETPLAETANATDALSIELTSAFTSTAAATDAVEISFTNDLSSTAAATDAVVAGLAAYEVLSSSGDATDTVAIVFSPTLNVTERAAATDAAAQHLVATQNLISRGVAFDFFVEDLTGAALWMNTETTAGARFPAYPFNSLAQHGEYLLGVGDAGLYIIDTGDTDAGGDIDARVMTGLMDFGDPHNKVLDGMILSGTSDGKINVTVKSAQGEFIYPTHLSTAEQAKNNRAQLGRGFNSVYYGFEFSNVNGNDFKISSAHLELGTTNRKR